MWGRRKKQTPDPIDQGTMDRQTIALNNLTATISQIGKALMTTIQESADAAVAVMGKVSVELGELAARITDLTAQLAAAAGDPAATQAIIDELNTAAAKLQASADSAAAVLPVPAPAPEPAPEPAPAA